MTICNFGQVRLGATRFKEQSVKRTCELSDGKPLPKTMKCLQ
jgi:hypothetical protein